MGGIFISYRRGGHIDVVLALGRRLVESFGSDQVFLDTESLRPGDRFSGKLEKAVLDSAVVLAVIHAQWLSECNENGVRRLDEPDDWVRKELELAVQSGKKIIPILLDETPMPGGTSCRSRSVTWWPTARPTGSVPAPAASTSKSSFRRSMATWRLAGHRQM
ncbi:MAG: toll/interleukin-1 receptor domain-containing protein [Pseudonocardiaceae bacterium]